MRISSSQPTISTHVPQNQKEKEKVNNQAIGYFIGIEFLLISKLIV